MRARPLFLAWLVVVATAGESRSSTLQERVAEFRATAESEHRQSLARDLLRFDVPIDDLIEAMRQPPRPAIPPPTGVLRWTWLDPQGRAHFARLHVPASYDARRAYPVYVYLHGDVQRYKNERDDDWWQPDPAFALDDRIVVFPAGWEDAKWWHEVKIGHLGALLDRLRSTYHVDTNLCVLSGVSDGGTGTWYQALHAPTPWASFLPFIGHPSVLNMPGEMASGEHYPVNLSQRAFFVINGRNDRKYPAASMQPYFDLFRRAGAELEIHLHDGGHDVRNWRELWPQMESFVNSHRRDPLPDRIRWRTDDPGRDGRMHWIQIDSLGAVPGQSRFDRFSVIEEPDEQGQPRKILGFRRDRASGEIEVQREGNRVEVRGEAVTLYRLMLSPDEFDFAKPITLVHEGTVLFDRRVSPSPETLLYWAARDNDPKMLFVAELRVDVRAAVVEVVGRFRGR